MEKRQVKTGLNFGIGIGGPLRNLIVSIQKRRRKVVIQNRVSHIIGIVISIKKGTLSKFPSIETHVSGILQTCGKFSPELLNRNSCEIICAACLYIDHYLKEDIPVELRNEALYVFENFKKHNTGDISSDELMDKFPKWLS